jgi:predicted phosphodiesterase
VYGPNSAFYTENKRTCISFRGYNDTNSKDLWEEYTNSVYNISTHLREKVGVDIVIALAHAGEPEDINLINSLSKYRKNGLPVVDIHIGAHTHQTYAYMKDGTYITNAGDCGIKLGVVEFEYSLQKNSRIKIIREDLHLDVLHYPHDDEIYRKKVDYYIRLLNDHFLNQIPFKFDTPVVTMKRDLKDPIEFAQFTINAIYHQMNSEIENEDSIYKTYRSNIDKVDVFFTSWDYIRAQPEFLKKNATLTFSDVFDLLGIGHIDKNINAYSLPYDPIVHWYVPKSKVQEMIEASKLYAKFVDSAADFVYADSLTFDFTWFGFPYVKSMATNLKLHGKPYHEWPEMIQFEKIF